MGKIYGKWNEDETGDYFTSAGGTDYVVVGVDVDGIAWFRNTADRTADYVNQDDLVEL